ncbi:MAG: polyprenyl diphosphate synthase [Patescibacteria group bacterium]|nr:polyprenyl diphosphate synthase [Patescibacteria group bacterium]MDD4610350.1 polyprenyl diphosphate synthase [Patescibacteria group bacterium]
METNSKKIPNHIGIIIGGQEEWARERNLPKEDGYAKSFEKIWRAPSWFFNNGVKIISVLILSASDWEKDQEKLNNLLKQLKISLENQLKEDFHFKINIYGATNELPGDLPDLCAEIIDKTKNNSEGALNLFINYSGRGEIIGAVQKMINNNIQVEQTHEGILRKYLLSSEAPDLDLILLTGGIKNLPDFLPWQSINSRIILSNKYWPDIEEKDAENILK